MIKEYLKVLISHIPWVLIILIIYGMSMLYPDFMMSTKSMKFEYDIYRTIFAIGTFAIGVLIEAERLFLAFNKGFSINWFYLVISILLLVILLLPFLLSIKLTGYGVRYTLLQFGLFRSILGICCGIIFVKSITANRKKVVD